MQVLANKNKGFNVLVGVLIIMGSLTIGWIIAQEQFRWLSILGIVVVSALCLAQPVLAAALTLSFAFINPSLLPPVMEIGEFTVRYVDGAIVLLATAVFFRFAIQHRIPSEQEWWVIFKPLFPLLVYVGLSLGSVWIYMPNILEASIASYIRLMTTVLLGLLVYMSLGQEKDLKFFARAVMMLAAASIAVGGWEALTGPKEVMAAGRYGGFLGFNTFGLVAGLLTLWAIIARVNKKPMLSWVTPLAAGLTGLFLSKSGSSALATIGAVTFLWAVFNRRGVARDTRLLRLLLGGLMAVGLGIWALWLLRPSDFIGLVSLSGGSWAQRTALAYAALLIFLSHPLFGVGWQASSTKAVVGDPMLNEVLMETFPKLPKHYFFLERPTSLHNLYMQLLAELGIVGFLLFVYSVVGVGKTVASILKQIPHMSPFRQWALFATNGLIYLLIWWNTNPLYGGQTESILAIVFLSLLAVLWRLQKENDSKQKIRKKVEIP